MLGFSDDIMRAFAPALYIGMRPESLGYKFADDAEKITKVKEMRENFVKNEVRLNLDVNFSLPSFPVSMHSATLHTGFSHM